MLKSTRTTENQLIKPVLAYAYGEGELRLAFPEATANFQDYYYRVANEVAQAFHAGASEYDLINMLPGGYKQC